MNYKIKIKDAEYEVRIRKVEDTKAYLTVNDEMFEVEIDGLNVNPTRMSSRTATKQIQPVIPVTTKKLTRYNHDIQPPLPGIILDICVEEGDNVKKGQVLYVLEAMKMENNIESNYDGIIEKIHRTKGESVLESDVILTIK